LAARGGRSGAARPAAVDDFGGTRADFGDIFEGMFGGAAAVAAGQRRASAASAPDRARSPRAPMSPIAWRVDFEDAAALKPQRITLGNGKTIDLKLPPTRVAAPRCGSPARAEGPGGPGDAIVTIEVQPHRFFTRDGDDVRLDLPSASTRRCSA
jgi:DnaJ-class molecular chaperone